MIKTDENGKVEGRIEFDILVDGKYQKRVTKGVLLEDKGFGCEMCLCGSRATIFNALMSLEKYVKTHDLQEEFDAYKGVVVADFSNIDATIEALDKFLSMIK